jgi:hypothetical protein
VVHSYRELGGKEGFIPLFHALEPLPKKFLAIAVNVG